MPNQRKKSKVHLGGYYEKKLKVELLAIAKARGIHLSELLEELLEAAVREHKRRRGESQAVVE